MGLVAQEVLYGETCTPHEAADLHYRFPPVEGVRAPPSLRRNARMKAGLQLREIPRTNATRESLLGPAEPLSHPLVPGDTGSPGHHLLDNFPEDFARAPYRRGCCSTCLQQL